MKSPRNIPPDSPPSPLRPVDFASTPTSKRAATRPGVVTYLHSHTAATRQAALTKLMKRLDSNRFAQRSLKPPSGKKIDPYNLVLLADQELGEGREEQARYLIEAAYGAYDQQNESPPAACTPWTKDRFENYRSQTPIMKRPQ
jgi:hypothetical protein